MFKYLFIARAFRDFCDPSHFFVYKFNVYYTFTYVSFNNESVINYVTLLMKGQVLLTTC